MQDDEHFDLFWSNVNQKVKALDVEGAVLSKKRRPPSRLDDYYGKEPPEFPADVASHYRRIYFESLDCIISAIRDRFDQDDYRAYVQLENTFLKEAKGENFTTEYNAVMETYAGNFNKN